jgi:hypothetical protein
MRLRRKLAEFGFESNDDYDFALQCLLDSESSTLRCAELVGTVARRKTAFAHALALALDYPHRLYHDFSKPAEAAETIMVKADDANAMDIKAAKPLSNFERILTEACAFSESTRTILVLDQLQLCDFADQMRLFQFISTGAWLAGVQAHPRNLLVLLISNEPLYHSLQKLSFRIFTDAGVGTVDFKPSDFGMPADAAPLLEKFAHIFAGLGAAPTLSEYQKILQDCDQRVRTPEQLRTVLFGRMERIDRTALYAAALEKPCQAVVDEVARLLGVEEISLG